MFQVNLNNRSPPNACYNASRPQNSRNTRNNGKKAPRPGIGQSADRSGADQDPRRPAEGADSRGVGSRRADDQAGRRAARGEADQAVPPRRGHGAGGTDPHDANPPEPRHPREVLSSGRQALRGRPAVVQ